MKQELAPHIIHLLRQYGQRLATAESCTGGLIGATLTAVPGCSEVYSGGMISYCNSAKQKLLGIPQNILESQGAVSESVAILMAEACKTKLGCDWGVSTTGFAGPDGGTPENPVGSVWMAISGPKGTTAEKKIFHGTRIQIQSQAVQSLMNSLLKAVETVHNITCSFEH